MPEAPGSMAGWQPRPGEDVHGLDEPVWHEGDTRTGDRLVRFRADVLGARPPVWRRLECRGALTLDLVHPVLATAFGWPVEGEHHFTDVVREERSTRTGVSFGNQWTRPGARVGPEEWTVPLSAVLAGPRERMRYSYGHAGLEVTIVAEDVMPQPPSATGTIPPARVLAGRRASPPTPALGPLDGGASGPSRTTPNAPLFDLSLPAGFDPEVFDLAETDRRVRAVAERDSPSR